MKKLIILILTAILVLASNIMAVNQGNDSKKTATPVKGNSQVKTQNKQAGTTQHPVIININRQSSGGHNQNFPSQQKQNPVQQQAKQAPTYGKLQLAPNNKVGQQVQNNRQPQPVSKPTQSNNHPEINNFPSQQKQNPSQQQTKQTQINDKQQSAPNNNAGQQAQNNRQSQPVSKPTQSNEHPEINNFPSQQKQNSSQQQTKQAQINDKQQSAPNNNAGQQAQNNRQSQPVSKLTQPNEHPEINVANVSHHHPYEPNYVRKKLQKLGVKSEPGYIINREEVVHTDRAHSIIAYPKEGFDKQPLNAAAFSNRHFNDNTVRAHMSLVSNIQWQENINRFNQTEIQANHYYWHNEKNFNYCHYIDNSGYHWYGWYLGNKYFWTRYFNNRWWWYDEDYDHWCFWNDGFWWWQDPYHIGDLYCYNDADYVPCNSAEDNVAVVMPDNNNTQNFTSPDNTRIVKVITDTQDAFLYDASNPPSFNPIYLASGVQDVMFSNSNNGKPLEIILKLNDGSFDMFDGNGNPYNLGTSE